MYYRKTFRQTSDVRFITQVLSRHIISLCYRGYFATSYVRLLLLSLSNTKLKRQRCLCEVKRHLFTGNVSPGFPITKCVIVLELTRNPHKSHRARSKNGLRLWENKNFLFSQNQTEFAPFKLSLSKSFGEFFCLLLRLSVCVEKCIFVEFLRVSQ